MTRTARAAYPRAVIKDRSESRSGLDTSMRKGGAGHHNWGSLADERQLESAALDDETLDIDEEASVLEGQSPTTTASSDGHPTLITSISNTSMTEEELEEARKFRKHALKKAGSGELDLAAIARTSAAVSASPPSADNTVRRPGLDNKQVHVSDANSV